MGYPQGGKWKLKKRKNENKYQHEKFQVVGGIWTHDLLLQSQIQIRLQQSSQLIPL